MKIVSFQNSECAPCPPVCAPSSTKLKSVNPKQQLVIGTHSPAGSPADVCRKKTGSMQIYWKYTNIQEIYIYTGNIQIYRKYTNIQEICKYTGNIQIYNLSLAPTLQQALHRGL